jgi:hypothetical protein
MEDLLRYAEITTSSPDTKRRGLEFHLYNCPQDLIWRSPCSVATAWAPHALSQNTAIQVKLGNEDLTLSTANLSMEELDSLPYLETVVR